MGLARGDYYFHLGDRTRQPGPLYIDGMFREDLIEERTFSFFLSSREKSYVDFGPPQSSAVKNLDDIRYINNLDDFFWSAYNQGVAVGSTNQADIFSYESVSYSQEKDNSLYTLFDTGTATINFSALYFDDFIERIFEYVGGNDYEVIQGYVVTKCYGNFPRLYFMFDL